jgi:hypothetical protein
MIIDGDKVWNRTEVVVAYYKSLSRRWSGAAEEVHEITQLSQPIFEPDIQVRRTVIVPSCWVGSV